MSIMTEQAWKTFHVPLLQFIRKRVSQNEIAEDLLQEVFLKVHQQITTLKDTRKLESWIYQIARNVIIDYYRGKRQMVTLEDPEVLQLPEELPDDDVISELFPAVRIMLNGLPEQDRQALVLTEYQGLTQKELSIRLGLSFSGAKSRVQRAREKLRQQLLACCHFELDRRGHVIDYQSRCTCCSTDSCCDDKTTIQPPPQTVRPFSKSLVYTGSSGNRFSVKGKTGNEYRSHK